MPKLKPLAYEDIQVGSYHHPITLTLLLFGVPEVLTGATIEFQMVRDDGYIKVPWALGTEPSTGILQFAFGSADVDTAGTYWCQWRVTYVDAKPWKSPKIKLEIQPDP